MDQGGQTEDVAPVTENQRVAYRPVGAVATSLVNTDGAAVVREENGGEKEVVAAPQMTNPYKLDVETGATVTASYPFQGDDELKQLSFTVGDRITVVEKEEMWSWGKLEKGGKEGWFPHNYVGSMFKPLPGIHEMAAKARERRERQEAAAAAAAAAAGTTTSLEVDTNINQEGSPSGTGDKTAVGVDVGVGVDVDVDVGVGAASEEEKEYSVEKEALSGAAAASTTASYAASAVEPGTGTSGSDPSSDNTSSIPAGGKGSTSTELKNESLEHMGGERNSTEGMTSQSKEETPVAGLNAGSPTTGLREGKVSGEGAPGHALPLPPMPAVSMVVGSGPVLPPFSKDAEVKKVGIDSGGGEVGSKSCEEEKGPAPEGGQAMQIDGVGQTASVEGVAVRTGCKCNVM